MNPTSSASDTVSREAYIMKRGKGKVNAMFAGVRKCLLKIGKHVHRHDSRQGQLKEHHVATGEPRSPPQKPINMATSGDSPNPSNLTIADPSPDMDETYTNEEHLPKLVIQQGDDPTWVFAGEAEDDYTSASSKLVIAHDGKKICVAILPTQQLSTQLQAAVFDHRRTEAAEDRADQELATLESEAQHLRQEIIRVQSAIDAIEAVEVAGVQDELTSLQQELYQLQQRSDTNDGMRAELHHQMNEMYAELRRKHLELFDAFDELFVQGSLIPAAGYAIAEQGTDATNTMLLNHPDDDENRSRSPALSSPSLRRRPASEDLRKSAPEQPVRHQLELTNTTFPTRDELLYNYKMWRDNLVQAENALEDRHELFDQQTRERADKIAREQPCQTSTELDLQQILKTIALTQNVKQAEQALEEAKAAAIAAGMQVPGSDVDSGFVDRHDDGYVISEEREMHAVNDYAIWAWLENTQDAVGDDAITDSGQDGVATWPDVHNWDARSVALSDSRSLVDVTRNGKKLREWRAKCDLLRDRSNDRRE